ncbi:MAG: SIS domain-containing protein [Actinobacteria bacterium]|nr:SIS domain-containing protein [Actinomycetota bacterium]
MLNFDPARFVSIQQGAVGLGPALDKTVSGLLDAGARNLYFLGAGGAGVLMQPAAELLDRSGAFPVRLVRPAELVAMGSVDLGAESIVVLPSLSGTTSESVEVLEFTHERGAKVIALTGHADSPVAEQADFNFTNFAEDDTSSESFYLQSLLLVLSIMCARGEFPRYEEVVGELTLLPELLLEVKRAFEPRAASLAEAFRDEQYHILTGSGSVWPEAWYYGTCILEEMQWIRTRPIHAADFFHGTLELVENDVSVIILKGEDSARPLVDRVEAFAPIVSDKVTVIDSASFELPGLSADVRSLVSPVVLATVLERLSAHLEVLREHPLTTRRYYRRVDY